MGRVIPGDLVGSFATGYSVKIKVHDGLRWETIPAFHSADCATVAPSNKHSCA